MALIRNGTTGGLADSPEPSCSVTAGWLNMDYTGRTSGGNGLQGEE